MSSGDPWGGPLIALLILLLIHGFLNAFEAALEALSDSRLHARAEEGDRAAQRLLPLLRGREESVAALRTGAVFTGLLTAGITAQFFGTRLTTALSRAGVSLPADWLGGLCCLALTLVLCCLMLTLARALPRAMGEAKAENLLLRLGGFARFLAALFRPLLRLSEGTVRALSRVFGLEKPAPAEEVTEEDIRQLVDLGEEAGAIEENEKELIENIFEFSDRIAEDVMTHRTDVTALWVNDTHDDVVRTILDTGLSRFPVYEKDMDDIIGILNTRDYLLANRNGRHRSIRSLLREAYFVPETVQADALFRDMQKRKVHMAIVVDEYGGMSGIVTMEDLLEEIVGNIYDEFDPQAEAEIAPLGENLWRISGAAALGDVAEALDVQLPTEEDYDTLGGLIFSQLTTIPADGSQPEVDACGLHIQVERMAEHRVETALVSKLVPEETEEPREAEALEAEASGGKPAASVRTEP